MMVAAANLVEVAALVGDTARATMLNALMGGQSLTATELAYCANVSRSTASGHLSKLVAARLLTVTRQRRFSYYRIASPLVATMLESMKVVAAVELPPRRQPRSAKDDALRFARSCYDHLAGQVGVAVTDALVAMGHIVLTDEGGEVTASGGRFLCAFGADLTPRTRRIFCQPCLDWSERRFTSRDSSELGFWIVYWSSDGSNVCRAAVHSNLRRLEGRACPKPSIPRSMRSVCQAVENTMRYAKQFSLSVHVAYWHFADIRECPLTMAKRTLANQ
jgi:DNA-binding transcriptional ArsR family regulator